MSTIQSLPLYKLDENNTFSISRNNVPSSNIYTLLHKISDGLCVVEGSSGLPKLLSCYQLVFPISKPCL